MTTVQEKIVRPESVAPAPAEPTAEQRLAAARAEADRIAAAKAQADQMAASLEAKLAELQAKAAAAKADAEKAARAEKKARGAIVDAQRQIEPPPVNLDAAREVAERLLSAFDAAAGGDARETVSKLWDATDEARCRLLTSRVSDDAQRLTLAIEGAIRSLDDWEHARSSEFNDRLDDDPEFRERHEIFDIRGLFRPSQSGRINRRFDELRIILHGGDPPAATESIGRLFAEGLSPLQICRTVGMLRADGSPDTAMLGTIIDSALHKAGYREVAPWHHLIEVGAMTTAEAWKLRQRQLPDRRTAEQGKPGSPARFGEWRSGRQVQIARTSAPEMTPAFRQSVQTIAERNAANRKRREADAGTEV